MARSWTIERLDGTTATRNLPDVMTPMAWQGFIAVTNPRGPLAPLEIHAPGSDNAAIVLVRLTNAPFPGAAYTYTVTRLSGTTLSFTLPDPLGLDQFSAEGKGAVSITAPVTGFPNLREPILVARADFVRSITVAPLE